MTESVRFRTTILAALLTLAPSSPTALAGGQLELTVIDRDTGKPIACRMHLKTAAGKPRKADKVPFYHDHFVVPGKITLKLPVGQYTFEMERGPEYPVRHGEFKIDNFADDTKKVDMGRFVDMAAKGWYSGDLYVRRNPREIEQIMEAEDLHVAQVVTWWNDKSDSGREPSAKSPLVSFDRNRFYHLAAGGYAPRGDELLLLNLPGPITLTSAGKTPAVARLIRAGRQQPDFWVDVSRPASWDLPLLVAAGQVDSLQLANSLFCRDSFTAVEGDGKPRDKKRFPGNLVGPPEWVQHVYFQLLECGLRIPPTAGSGSGVAPNPPGYNRVYVHVDGELTYRKWWDSLRAGRVVVTNGPLMQPTVNGQLPGHVFQLDKGRKLEFEIGLTLSTRDPITYLQIIKNGRVEKSIRFEEYAASGRLPKIEFDDAGWFLLRAVTDVPKNYRFAMTGPYYVESNYQRRISKQAAQFFLDWLIERGRMLKQADPDMPAEAIEDFRAARDYWQGVLGKATAE
jgi:hypothetical protein